MYSLGCRAGRVFRHDGLRNGALKSNLLRVSSFARIPTSFEFLNALGIVCFPLGKCEVSVHIRRDYDISARGSCRKRYLQFLYTSGMKTWKVMSLSSSWTLDDVVMNRGSAGFMHLAMSYSLCRYMPPPIFRRLYTPRTIPLT